MMDGDASTDNNDNERAASVEIHIVSGGVGASAELLTHTVLAQYPSVNAPIIVHPHVHDIEKVREIVAEAARSDGVILHTLVETAVRAAMIEEAQRQGVDAIDVAGPVMDLLSERLAKSPIGQPGRYRKLYGQYFKRVEAIEFTIAHDDGQRTADLDKADIVLIGVSRLGKTPLSMYLAMQGWKVANVPFVPGVKLPDELWRLDARRVVGLMIEPPQLAVHRRWREKRLGVDLHGYTGRMGIAEELREANRFYVAHEIPVVDVSEKPIETSGMEIIGVITRRVNGMPRTTLNK